MLLLAPRMKAYDDAVESGSRTPAKDVEHMRGYYRCCIWKWKKQRKMENWSLVAAASPRLAKKHSELPDILRKFMGLKCKFKSRKPAHASSECQHTSILPPALTDVVGAMVASGLHHQFHHRLGHLGCGCPFKSLFL